MGISIYCKCGEPKRKGGRYCRECHNAHMREWRKTHKMNDEQRLKANCRSYAKVYLSRGKIVSLPCEKCGKKAEMHHEDYNKPLEVRWLCREHHRGEHWIKLG